MATEVVNRKYLLGPGDTLFLLLSPLFLLPLRKVSTEQLWGDPEGRLGCSWCPLPLQEFHSGKLETGRVAVPTAGRCFHFQPLWDDMGTPVVLDLQCHPSCMKYKDSLAPSDIH